MVCYIKYLPEQDVHDSIIEGLSTDVFEPRTSTGGRNFDTYYVENVKL